MPEPQYTAQIRRASMPELCYRVRSLDEQDIPQLMEVRQELRVHDCESVVETSNLIDPEGIKVIQTNTGDVVGACSAVATSDELCVVGLYCVREKFQGCGLGVKVWRAAMDHIGDRNACLNAVPGKMEMYRDKAGFPIVEHDFKCVKNFTDDIVDTKNLSSHIPQGVSILPYQDCLLSLMLEYDYSLVGFNRDYILALNCREKNSKTYVALKDGKCVGFGTIKTSCLGGGRVGPLYADDSEVAEGLLKSLIESLSNVTSFVMSTLSNNVSAKRLLKKLDVPEKEQLTRMYSKQKLDVDTKKIYALFDLNFAPF